MRSLVVDSEAETGDCQLGNEITRVRNIQGEMRIPFRRDGYANVMVVCASLSFEKRSIRHEFSQSGCSRCQYGSKILTDFRYRSNHELLRHQDVVDVHERFGLRGNR
jgi:hypothetical protein